MDNIKKENIKNCEKKKRPYLKEQVYNFASKDSNAVYC